jgi:hypothetical protein
MKEHSFMTKTDIASKTKTELLKLAQRLGLRGISTLNKDALVERIRRGQQRVAAVIKRRAIRKPEKTSSTMKKTSAKTRQNAKSPVKKKPATTPKPVLAKQAKRTKKDAGFEQVKAELSAHKFDVAPTAKAPKQVFIEENLGHLPESYGTGRLFLTARDPQWLFAYWDLTWQQLADYRGKSSDSRVVLRVFEKNHATPIHEVTLHNDARNWYIPVSKAATTYRAELGYWRHDGSFHVISQSREATTPAATISTDTTAHFVTIPVDIAFAELLNLVRVHMPEGAKLAEALQQLQRHGAPLPFKVDVALGPWTDEQESQLARLVTGDLMRRVNMGSLELVEWLQRRLREESSSGIFSAFSPAGASWSGMPQQGFWFAVNAELIIYGATEPDATVTIDGKPVELRKDGTFTFHYTFPDGKYRLPVVAVSGKTGENRSVNLSFERQTKTQGEVGRVQQPTHLQPPQS